MTKRRRSETDSAARELAAFVFDAATGWFSYAKAPERERRRQQRHLVVLCLVLSVVAIVATGRVAAAAPIIVGFTLVLGVLALGSGVARISERRDR